MTKIDLSIVLPAYKEEKNLSIILPLINQIVKNMHIQYEILIIDACFPVDKTKKICQKYKVRHLYREGGNDFGSAVKTGIKEAEGEKILFMDADGSHTPETIPILFDHSKNYDLVIASRYIDQGETENHWILTAMSRILNLSFKYILSIPCNDISNSFKMYNKKDLKPLNLKCKNFDIVEEIIYKIFKSNPTLSYIEIPFKFKKRIFGDSKRNLFLFILTYIFTIIKLRFNN
jgi:dolichol-phosphate mannosyltransferase